MKTFLICILSSLILLISACNKDKIPGVYRIDIQQGNYVTQEMVDKLKPNMSKKQVTYILGTPLLIDTFNPDRWDYIYSFHPGNGVREQRRLTLFFYNDKLNHIDGNIRVVAQQDLSQTDDKAKNVVVPLTEEKTGILDRLLNTVGLGDNASKTTSNENEMISAEETLDQNTEPTNQ